MRDKIRDFEVGDTVPKKVYVASGELQWLGIASGCLDAVKKALEKCRGSVLDSQYFFISECGFRTDNAEFRVPVEKGLKYAGYPYDDPNMATD